MNHNPGQIQCYSLGIRTTVLYILYASYLYSNFAHICTCYIIFITHKKICI